MKKIIGLLIAAILFVGIAFGVNQSKGNVVGANKADVESGSPNESNSGETSSPNDENNGQAQSNKEDASKNLTKENEESKVSKEASKDSANKAEDKTAEENKSSTSGEENKASSTSKDNSNSQATENKNDKVTTNTSNNNSSAAVTEDKKVETPKKENKETVTISINANKAINYGIRKEDGFSHLPSNGVILGTTKVNIKEGENVFDVLAQVVREHKIQMEYTGAGSAIYIQGIDNLYEFDCGKYSGWMYEVNGVYPNYGVGAYKLKDGDNIVFNYTCDLGKDLGAPVP